MRTGLSCPACIIDDLHGALQGAVADEGLQQRILREALAWLGSELDFEHIPSFYITGVHRLLKARASLVMPFRELRQRCNAAGLVLAPRLRATSEAIADDLERFRYLVRWAIAGNHLDFRTVGTGYDLVPEAIEAKLQQVVAEGLTIDDTAAILSLVRQRPRVLYLADNVGEIALDVLLIAELGRHGCPVLVAVKGGPITSDAVLADARVVGIDRLAPVIVAGPDTLGIPIGQEMAVALRDALAEADLIIAKGQANFYALSELAPKLRAYSACLLRTKCILAASALGATKPRANVAKLLPTQTAHSQQEH